MDSTSAPTKIELPFADAGGKRVIPVPSQVPGDPGAASFTDGFPPLTRTPIAAGGIPPMGIDMNGILNMITAVQQWQSAGGLFAFDPVFATAVGGYPKGAYVISADESVIWLNTAEDNTANPDTVGTGWVPAVAPNTFAQTGLAGGTVTPALSDAAKGRITLAGVLSSNLTYVLPNWVKGWQIVNNTTGAFSVTVKTAAGTGVTIPQNGADTHVYGDGTNITRPRINVPEATATGQAPQMGQVTGVVGSARNLRMVVTSPSSSATLTADEIIVQTALGGVRYCMSSQTRAINLATNGAGGMDTGAAPSNGWVAVYMIYNPTAGLSALLGVNATSVTAPSIYGGANMPAGYTASALVSVWRTNGSGQFAAGVQVDRTVSKDTAVALNSTTNQASYTALGISSAAPRNAVSISGSLSVGNIATVSQTTTLDVASDSSGVGSQIATFSATSSSGFQVVPPFSHLLLAAVQTMYYKATTNAGTATYVVNVSSYTF